MRAAKQNENSSHPNRDFERWTDVPEPRNPLLPSNFLIMYKIKKAFYLSTIGDYQSKHCKIYGSSFDSFEPGRWEDINGKLWCSDLILFPVSVHEALFLLSTIPGGSILLSDQPIRLSDRAEYKDFVFISESAYGCEKYSQSGLLPWAGWDISRSIKQKRYFLDAALVDCVDALHLWIDSIVINRSWIDEIATEFCDEFKGLNYGR